jgi:hypothetical protein
MAMASHMRPHIDSPLLHAECIPGPLRVRTPVLNQSGPVGGYGLALFTIATICEVHIDATRENVLYM